MGQKRTELSVEDLARGVLEGSHATLARAITLVESTRADHRTLAQDLVQRLLPHAGRAVRVGLTGVPGVGKSTAIDRLGTDLIDRGHKVAVLAIDPTSRRTGGAILGDKTRMHRLAQRSEAFIRPSPTSGTLGGVARRTRETMVLVEAAGFDVVIVETVGVGQSETAVADMVDVFVVLLLAGAGDELQGIKRGVIEMAEIIAITKADGDNVERAKRAAGELQGALNIISPPSQHWRPSVLTVSAQTNQGLDALWAAILEHRRVMKAAGELEARRRRQSVAWMRDLLNEGLMSLVLDDDATARRLRELEGRVASGKLTPALAVEEILALVAPSRHGTARRQGC
ncbi:MAG: methylmalonyl Co-A mutase-associated GTPase MeaB [Bacteroidota bacterium]